MKKESGSRIGRLVKRIFNIKAWSDWSRIKAFTLYIISSIKLLFVLQPPKEAESFESVMARLKLTDDDIAERKKGLFRLSIIMIGMAFLIFSYTIYEVVQGHILSFILGLIITAIALVMAFRYHFWYFQIKQRKLGCTITEWYHQGLKGGQK